MNERKSMNLATNTLESLMSATQAVLRTGQRQQETPRVWHRLERLLRRHDRKGELRAWILSLEPNQFRELSRRHTLEFLARQAGFRDIRGFSIALTGKLTEELRSRGWSIARIERRLSVRSIRAAHAF